MKRVGSSGPRDAKYVIVGEAPGADEEREGKPFVGKAGQELDTMLAEAGIDRAECFITNVAKYRPAGNDFDVFIPKKKLLDGTEVRLHDKLVKPVVFEGYKELVDDIRSINPRMILCFGNVPMWAVTGICGNASRQAPPTGIASWRGSQLTAQGLGLPNKVIPTYHPAAILRMFHWRAIAVHDLRRAVREAGEAEFRLPPWRFLVRPSFQQTVDTLRQLLARAAATQLALAVDLETRRGHIACVGVAWSTVDALCVPFIDAKKPDLSYWALEEEKAVVALLRTLLLHPNVRIIGQNFLYDLQYLIRYWGTAPRVAIDTMLAHHVCFPGTPKGLDYLSSFYCSFHQYWKDEGKDFDPYKDDEDRLWTYNCRDAVATFEVAQEQWDTIRQLKREAQFAFQQYDLYPAVLGMMLRGVRINKTLRGNLMSEILGHQSEREAMINFFAQRPVNPRSPKQLQELFFDEFKQKRVINRKTGQPTTDEDALDLIGKREPLLRRICGAINEVRSLGAAINVLRSPLDSDERMRCSYNVAGPETFRFSSSENAFGGGTNLQNITSGRVSEYTGLQLPNMRRLMIPSPGHMIAEGDLDRADLQVVVWEADDVDLKAKLRANVDLHKENAADIYGLRSSSSVTYIQRQVAKVFCHATNYGGKSRTVAAACGLSVHETEVMQLRWFGAHPGIKAWHHRTEDQLAASRTVRNAFGYARFYFDRIEECLPEALAWVPQSTVAIVINHILVALHKHCRDVVTLLLQVHDSLVFEYVESLHPRVFQSILPHTRVTVPYPDPLIIPVSFKASPLSWGECEKVSLEEKLLNPAENAAQTPLRLA